MSPYLNCLLFVTKRDPQKFISIEFHLFANIQAVHAPVPFIMGMESDDLEDAFVPESVSLFLNF